MCGCVGCKFREPRSSDSLVIVINLKAKELFLRPPYCLFTIQQVE
jgi:hypothetical protein